NNAMAHKMMAAACQKLGDPACVKTHVMAAYNAGLRDPIITQLAGIYLEEDKPLEAIPSREKQAKEHPEDVENIGRLGLLYGKTGRNDDALASFRQVQRKVPDDVPANVQLANQLWRMGQLPAAPQLLESLMAR